MIEFDFNPNRESFTDKGKRPAGGREAGIAEFYPGDAWVDWVSFSTYNRGFLRDNDQRVHTFAEDLRTVYGIMDRVAGPSVRFSISETSTTDQGGLDKKQWFGDLLKSIETEFTRIGIVNFFLIDKHNEGEKPALWGLHGPGEHAMLKQLLADFRVRMGMPVPPKF